MNESVLYNYYSYSGCVLLNEVIHYYNYVSLIIIIEYNNNNTQLIIAE